MSVQYLKLLSGEEILATVVEMADSYVVVENPLLITLLASDQGDHSIFMSRWTPYSGSRRVMVYRAAMAILPAPVSGLVEENYTLAVKAAALDADPSFDESMAWANAAMRSRLEQAITAAMTESVSEEPVVINSPRIKGVPSPNFKQNLILSTLAKTTTTKN